jgi:lipopolysaccharide export system protein LptA
MMPRRACLCLLALALCSRGACAEAPAVKALVPAAAAPAIPPVPTVIESGSAEMVSTEKETTFTFRNGVTVTGTNLKLTCDHLEVIARRTGDPSATFGKQENFKSLIATGKVHIVQSDREATCERAEVFPGDDKVILTGDPKVRSIDGQYQAAGPKMVLHRGERRAQIISEGGERPRISLPPLKDLGYEKEKEKKKSPAQPASPPPGTTPEPTSPIITVPLTPPPK